MQYGYCRISTPKQSIERQIRNITAAAPEARIIEEVYTGTKTQGREKWQQLYRTVKAGDTIIFDSVSRMSRNAEEGFQLYQDLYKRGVTLEFLKEPHVNTETYKAAIDQKMQINVSTGDEAADELVNSITAAIEKYMMRLAAQQIRLAFEQSEKEAADLRQRTKEGIETARLAGKQIGQAEGKRLNVKKEAAAKKIIRKHAVAFGGTLGDEECRKLAGISRNTYYKYKREIKES